MRSLSWLVVFWASGSIAAPIDTRQTSHQLASHIIEGEVAKLEGHTEPSYLDAIGGRAGLTDLVRQVAAKGGKEVELLEERHFRSRDRILNYRISRYEKMPLGRLDLSFALDGGRLLGARFGVAGNKAPTARHDFISKTKLRLPFQTPKAGYVWQVIWGGSSLLDNYHGGGDTHYAIDFNIGRPNDPVRPAAADDPCMDQPILAAAAGRVVATVANLSDEPDVSAGPGNHVIVDHGHSEFTLYAHLRRGSIIVAPGQKVSQGQELGRCGNSGASSGPHLHFQLMTSANVSKAEALPIWFHDYFAPVRHVTKGQLLRGDMVLPGATAAPKE